MNPIQIRKGFFMGLEYKGDFVRLYSGSFNRSGHGYQVRYIDGAGKSVRKMVPESAMPLEYAKSLDRQIGLAGTQSVEGPKKFKEAAKSYVKELDEHLLNYRQESKHGHKISAGTHKKYMIAVNLHIVPHFQNMNLSAIRISTVQDFQDQLRKRMKPQTANQVVNCLGRMMSYFVRKEWIEANPCREIRSLPEDAIERGRTPTQKEVQKVIMHCREDWHEVLVRVCAEAGLRISEALGLEWTNIRNDILYIKQSAVRAEIGKTKTAGSKRAVKISAQTATMMKELRVKSINQFVFANEKGRLLTSSDALNQALHPACKLAGVELFGWHGLRRLVINTLLDNNVMRDHVQKIVGHTIGSKVTDKHYREIDDEAVLRDDYVLKFPEAKSA